MKKELFLILIIFIVVIGFIWFIFNNSSKDDVSWQQLDYTELSKKSVLIEQDVSDNYEINGMKIDILKQGDGAVAKKNDNVFVHYSGFLENGKKFDSSVDRGEPFSFQLGSGMVISGWDLGVEGMKIGEKRKLTIPPELGYGNRDVGNGFIPPNSTLIFEVELLEIK